MRFRSRDQRWPRRARYLDLVEGAVTLSNRCIAMSESTSTSKVHGMLCQPGQCRSIRWGTFLGWSNEIVWLRVSSTVAAKDFVRRPYLQCYRSRCRVYSYGVCAIFARPCLQVSGVWRFVLLG